MFKRLLIPAIAIALALPICAQTDSQNDRDQDDNIQVEPMQKTPVYRVNVVERSTRAVDYQHKGGSTKVDFRGTELMPQAEGEAKVDNNKTGRLDVRTDFKHLEPATKLGAPYLTYVLWAITPQGRPVNLGEVVPDDGGKANPHVTAPLQAFGMIVTAEPYFAVTHPSNMVVLENVVRKDTKGPEMPIEAKFEAVDRGEYAVDINPADMPAKREHGRHVPLDLLEAENAVAIAKATGADQYAGDTLQRAQDQLARAEQYFDQKQDSKPISTVARAAAETAEDARVLTIRHKREEEVRQEREAQQARVTRARERARTESERAEQARLQAQQADQERLAAEQAKAQADQARQQAELAAQNAARERQEADAARQAAIAQQAQLAQQADEARLRAQKAEQEREQAQRSEQETRQRLLNQLNQVLQTRESARGLIVNMNDVLFATNQATLRPGARERLAKVAGIILAYPDLKLQVEGYTDSTGKPEYNQVLSEKRAATVRDYLISQGVPSNNIISRGLGQEDPIASNQTASGRQLNRRVELVVSGTAIGQNAQVQPGPGVDNGYNGGTSGAVGPNPAYPQNTPPAQQGNGIGNNSQNPPPPVPR